MSTNRLGSRLHSKTSGQTGKHTYQKKNIANPYSNTRLAKALDPRTGPWWMPGSASARRAPSHPAPRKWEVIMVLWMDEVLATKKPCFSCKHQQTMVCSGFKLVQVGVASPERATLGRVPSKKRWVACCLPLQKAQFAVPTERRHAQKGQVLSYMSSQKVALKASHFCTEGFKSRDQSKPRGFSLFLGCN